MPSTPSNILSSLHRLTAVISYTEDRTFHRGPIVLAYNDAYFWWHERFWRMFAPNSAVWRLLGERIGSRVFDDGCAIVEKTLVTIGDDCTLNAGTVIQCQSLADGTFKSDHTTIGSDCTLGIGSFVHYSVTIGDCAVLASDSFLMKGEEIPPRMVERKPSQADTSRRAHQPSLYTRRHQSPSPKRSE
jgi:hypothetical protein